PPGLLRVEHVECDRWDAPTPVLGIRAPSLEEAGQRPAVRVRCREALREDHRTGRTFRLGDETVEEHRAEHEPTYAAHTTSTWARIVRVNLTVSDWRPKIGRILHP